MQLIVQMSEAELVGRASKTRKSRGRSSALEVAAELGVSLRPMHPGATDRTLASYFVADVPDMATGERIASRLRRSRGVQAAYVKPDDELP